MKLFFVPTIGLPEAAEARDWLDPTGFNPLADMPDVVVNELVIASITSLGLFLLRRDGIGRLLFSTFPALVLLSFDPLLEFAGVEDVDVVGGNGGGISLDAFLPRSLSLFVCCS